LGKATCPKGICDHYGAVISCLAPNAPFKWTIPKSFVDFIVANDFHMPYVVLADGLSKNDSRAGEQAIFDHFGIGPGSFLINPSRW
jgi:hypothetical protein